VLIRAVARRRPGYRAGNCIAARRRAIGGRATFSLPSCSIGRSSLGSKRRSLLLASAA